MRDYARYSGMATEMFGLLIVMVFIGRKLDHYLQNEKYYVTALLVVIGVCGYLYRLYIQVTKKDDSE